MQKTAEVHAHKSERDYFIFVKKYFIDNFCMLCTVELKAQSVILFTTQGINRILMLLLSEHNSVSECTPGGFKAHHWPEQTNKINRHPTAHFSASNTVDANSLFSWFAGYATKYIHMKRGP